MPRSITTALAALALACLLAAAGRLSSPRTVRPSRRRRGAGDSHARAERLEGPADGPEPQGQPRAWRLRVRAAAGARREGAAMTILFAGMALTVAVWGAAIALGIDALVR
jgi:hypothetical protein